MIKIFKKDHKINFVDENNVFVGFDYSQYCYESYGYFLHTDKRTNCNTANIQNGDDYDLNDYIFDPKFIEIKNDKCYDSGGAATFRLVNKEKEELFLTIYNEHNGYYGHGFKFKIGDLTVREGCL